MTTRAAYNDGRPLDTDEAIRLLQQRSSIDFSRHSFIDVNVTDSDAVVRNRTHVLSELTEPDAISSSLVPAFRLGIDLTCLCHQRSEEFVQLASKARQTVTLLTDEMMLELVRSKVDRDENNANGSELERSWAVRQRTLRNAVVTALLPASEDHRASTTRDIINAAFADASPSLIDEAQLEADTLVSGKRLLEGLRDQIATTILSGLLWRRELYESIVKTQIDEFKNAADRKEWNELTRDIAIKLISLVPYLGTLLDAIEMYNKYVPTLIYKEGALSRAGRGAAEATAPFTAFIETYNCSLNVWLIIFNLHLKLLGNSVKTLDVFLPR